MIVLQAPRVLPRVPRHEWRTPSAAQVKDCMGNENQTRFQVRALRCGRLLWCGWFDDRDDADAFLFAAIMGTLHIEPVLCRIPTPAWMPGVHDEADIVWQCATTTFFTSGTSWTVASDWYNGDNIIECIGGGNNGSNGSVGASGRGGGGGAYSRAVNQSYTPSASRTIAVGGLGGDTLVKSDDNSTNAVLAKGASTATGGSASSGTGSTKTDGGSSGTASSTYGGTGGGGAGGASGAGSSGGNLTSGFAGSNGGAGGASGGGSGGSGGAFSAVGTSGGNGTNMDATHGAGGGGGGGGSFSNGGAGGNYGAGGGGGGGDDGENVAGTGGAGKGGLIAITWTPGSAAFKAGFNMPNGW